MVGRLVRIPAKARVFRAPQEPLRIGPDQPDAMSQLSAPGPGEPVGVNCGYGSGPWYARFDPERNR
jgi:hypothetical protein